MIIKPFVHRCVIQTGDLAGNKYWQEVTAIDAEYEIKCEQCGEVLATPNQLALHVYQELVE